MRTDYIKTEELRHVLAALTPENRLACEISLATGLRIGDVLSIKTEKLLRSKNHRISVTEEKTGKIHTVYIPVELYYRACHAAGKYFVFQHRYDAKRHRTRQAVFKDIKRAARAFRLRLNIAPHTCRKAWAVAEYHRTGSIERVQKLMNHSDEAVTMIYALADQLTNRRIKGLKKSV